MQHYEVNISLNGKHLFATAERSIRDQADLRRALPILRAKFPKSEGYEIGVTYWPATGYGLSSQQVEDVCAGKEISVRE